MVDVALSHSGLRSQAQTDKNIDPLVLDLNGDGIELTDWVSGSVFFDMLGDGTRHQTGWTAGGDGLLVRVTPNNQLFAFCSRSRR